MPKVPAPLFSPVYQNVDGVSLRDGQVEGYNFVADEKGGIERRPGLTTLWTDGTSPSKGIFYTSGRELYVARGVSVSKLTSSLLDGSFTTSSTSTTNPLASAVTVNGTAAQVSMATDGTYVFIADGGQLIYWNGSSATALARIATAPATSTHVAFLDGYIVANQSGTGKFYWSDPDASLTWNALSFATAVGAPDSLVALHVYDRKIFLFGTESLEVWENDGENPFSRIAGGFYARGIPNVYSVAVTKNGPVWLDRDNRACLWNNGVQDIPGPFDRSFSRFSSSLASGPTYCSVVNYYGREMVLYHFGSINRSFVFDFANPKPEWYEWSLYDSQAGYTGFPVQGAVRTRSFGQTIVQMGDRTGLFTLDPAYNRDDPDPDPIRLSRTSSAIDYGTNARKRSNGIFLRLKRGADQAGTRAAGAPEPVIVIRYKDDGGNWSNEFRVGLGYQGEREIVRRLPTRGIFRTRQYEITATDAVPLVYAFAEEDIEVMSS